MKKKIMLIVPMLHQGGFERVCVASGPSAGAFL